jgi:hypothetical protein
VPGQPAGSNSARRAVAQNQVKAVEAQQKIAQSVRRSNALDAKQPKESRAASEEDNSDKPDKEAEGE